MSDAGALLTPAADAVTCTVPADNSGRHVAVHGRDRTAAIRSPRKRDSTHHIVKLVVPHGGVTLLLPHLDRRG